MEEFSHVRILAAYLTRLPPIVFKRLHQANLDSWQETLNGNSRSQLSAQEAEIDVIRAAVECMTETDKLVIARIIREELTADIT